VKLKDKVAIVTGAGGGIGRATALLFAREGASVVVVDVKDEPARETASLIKEAGGRATALVADVSSSDDVKRMIEATVATLGVPTVLFNNAGLSPSFPKPALVNITEESFDRIIAVNLRGVWLGMKHAIPYMIKAGGGSIVNTASIAALVACNSAEYAASKAGVLALTRVAAQEYGPFNIRVNAICPGATATPMATRFAAANPAGSAASDPKRLERMGVLGRFAVPEEMAKAALFLASDDASYATGATFVIDGGWTIMALEGNAHYTPEPPNH
jgi:NAD(P)-dependent dehydrogenase (short-subunit alcohol dehydrogenase family)